MSNRLVDFILKDIDRDSFLQVQYERLLVEYILEQTPVDKHYFLRDEDMPQWIYAKGPKHEKRRKRDGSHYYFSEGSVQFPEPMNKPSRTMLTSEGQVGRTSHVVQDPSTGRLRVLTPIEWE